MRTVMWVFGILGTASLALAQGQQTTPAPAAYPGQTSTAMQWLITAVFLVAALVVAFKPAKRAKLE